MVKLVQRIDELYAHCVREFLFEMNVANLDEIRQSFAAMFNGVIAQRHIELSPSLRDFFVKRAVKAMQNDEQGNMVTRRQIAEPPENAPAWLVTALDNHQEVYEIAFKEGFETRLAHVVDWLAADMTAERTVRATPEQDFLGHLAKTADDYFAHQSKTQPAEPEGVEEGAEVIMTFRTTPGTDQVVAYKEDTIANDETRGPVVAFWARLTSAAALDREGKLMSHCVGSYAAAVASSHVVIYSLRDARNQPHVTIELNQRSEPPTINQVKGKSNAPPVGKYAGYVRDFLNDLGVDPSSTGRSDLRGMGLLSHKGKFGTIAEIGGNILATFKNGDTIRTLDDQDDESPYGYRRGKSENTMYWYVERGGTVPFRLTVWANKEIHDLKILRDEVSRYPVYAANLIPFLNESGATATTTDTLMQFDVFYDAMKHKWGTREDLLEVILSVKGVDISRLGDKVYLSQGKTLFATGLLDLSRNETKIYGLKHIKIVNDIPAVGSLPEIVAAFAAKFLNTEMFSLMSDSAKDTLYSMGLTRRSKQGFGTVPEDKTMYRSKHGSVREAQNRLFFYSKSGALLGSAYIGAHGQNAFVDGKGSVTTYAIKPNKLHIISKDNKREILQLISELTERTDIHVTVDNFDHHEERRDAADLGFIQKQNRLVSIAEVMFSHKLPGGFTVDSEAGQYRGQSITLKKGKREILSVEVDMEDDAVTSVNMTSGGKLADYRTQLAMLMNVGKLRVKRRLMIPWFLIWRNGKFAPQMDSRVSELYTDEVLPLGGKLMFHLSNYKQRLGAIEVRDPGERWGSTVVYMDWADEDRHHELTYKMVHRRELPKGVSRNQIIQATAKFMHFFHDKIEPYLSDELVGGRTVKKPKRTLDSE